MSQVFTSPLDSGARGFLPREDPAPQLPASLSAFDAAAAELPPRIASGAVRRWLAGLPPLDPQRLESPADAERAMRILSYFGHAWVWGEPEPVRSLPANLAVPWEAVAGRVGRPPVLSYASYALCNWRRLDPEGPVALGNIALLQNFLGGLDEDWFILVHVDIEARAADALTGLEAARASEDADTAAAALLRVRDALERMHATLARMPEGCDPYVYYRRVRPYIHGWKDNPALPDGLVYGGVGAWDGAPQRFRGETGAQSSIVPSLDAALGVEHAEDPLRPYLEEMRDYMPAPHRALIQAWEAEPRIRPRVLAQRGHAGLVEAYNGCLHWLHRFRALHLDYAANYINRQAQVGPANPVEVGTGGTPFMQYLRKHRDETLEFLL